MEVVSLRPHDFEVGVYGADVRVISYWQEGLLNCFGQESARKGVIDAHER